MRETVRIEVLGDLRVLGPGGELIELPASRKTKALLAYLALTGRQQFREHLCDLLWDGPDDPRGALRWSLSRLRSSLDGATQKRIESDRRSLALAPGAFTIDLHEAQRAMERRPGPPSIDALRKVAELFRGDLLEGLDLLDSFRFHAWCIGQREVARALRLKVLTALIDQVPESEEALKFAHVLVSIDPLSEAAHTKVIRLLMEMQRHGDAQEQANSYRRILEIELGEVPRDVATRLRKIVHSDAPAPRQAPESHERVSAVEALPMVGRRSELATLTAWLTRSDGGAPMALISGEPGAGKTRLMTEVGQRLGVGTLVIRGRAYQAESGRALGPWRDAFAEMDGAASVFSSAADAGAEPQQRAQLFEELLALVAAQGRALQRLVITLDDVQWLDEASAAFMHFLVRSRPKNVALMGTVRAEEIVDNRGLQEALESLRSGDAILELVLPPLAREEIARICCSVDERIDAEQVFGSSEGNPFLATEIALALARGESDLPSNVRHLVGARLRALSEPARDLLPWAAALGRTFHIDILERVTGLDPVALVERVGELEERGVFEPRATGAYDFMHDLVRDAAYRELSEPRRRIVHRSIARSLDSWQMSDAEFSATELLRHAELGGEAAIACRAGLSAAQDALSMCAWVDACVDADRGLQHISSLDAHSRVSTTLALLQCRITASSILERQHPKHVVSALSEVIELGGTAEQNAQALYLQSLVEFAHGHADRAERDLVAAADAGRLADPETAARRIANSARCLLHIESDVDRARSLLAEARGSLQSMDLEDVELSWAEALLARWDGDLEGASERLLQAIGLAKEGDNHWRQSSCLASLIMIASEAGDPDRVEELSRGGLVHEEATGEPLKSPFVEGLAALADFQRDPSSTGRLEQAIEVLRTRGANAQLSYLLSESARLHAEVGNLDKASAAAHEAVRLGEAVRRVVPHTDALVTIAWVYLQRGDTKAGLEALARAEQVARGGDSITARVRTRLQRVAEALRQSPT